MLTPSGSPALISAIISLKDLAGAELRRIRTLRQYLDDGESPDPGQRLPDDVYTVNRVVARDIVAVEFELVPILDLEGRQLPTRQCFRTSCGFVYRKYFPTGPLTDPFDYTDATCPYAGPLYFDRLGQAVTDPAKDKCGKRKSDCVKRFGEHKNLPFGGFPGMVRI
jgi:lambda family phage minor tail protein L